MKVLEDQQLVLDNTPKIHMVDLGAQYQELKPQIDHSVAEVINSQAFINGPAVKNFEKDLAAFHQVNSVIACANGTDALQIALMALELEKGAEVILPSFTYVATAEVIALLGLKPKMIDVDYDTFNIDVNQLKSAIGSNTKAIVPVHLFGQSANMEEIMNLAQENNIFVIEDNAQSIGADYSFSNGKVQKTGTLGHIGCTSFYPSKNLGAYGDAGAIMTNDADLSEKIRRIANHGQSTRYYHSTVGVNSRLDSIQAGILNIKLQYLNEFNKRRKELADFYETQLENLEDLILPANSSYSTHVYHQFTMKILNDRRDDLKEYLSENGIPSMIYYPVPLYRQEAYAEYYSGEPQPITERLCKEVLSLPMHPNMEKDQAQYITDKVKAFFN